MHQGFPIPVVLGFVAGGGPEGPPSPSPVPLWGGRTLLGSRDAAHEGPGLESTGSPGVSVTVCVSVRVCSRARTVARSGRVEKGEELGRQRAVEGGAAGGGQRRAGVGREGSGFSGDTR